MLLCQCCAAAGALDSAAAKGLFIESLKAFMDSLFAGDYEGLLHG